MHGFLTKLLPKQDPNNGNNRHTDFEEETFMWNLFHRQRTSCNYRLLRGVELAFPRVKFLIWLSNIKLLSGPAIVNRISSIHVCVCISVYVYVYVCTQP